MKIKKTSAGQHIVYIIIGILFLMAVSVILCVNQFFPCGYMPAAGPLTRGSQVMVVPFDRDPKSFNEIIANETSTTNVIGFIFEGLTEIDAVTTDPVPALAKEWEVSSDGLVWTFQLREDVKWNDGTPFTADDVIFTYNDLIYNDQIPSSVKDVFTIEGKKIEVKKEGPYTVTFTTPKIYAPLLRMVSQSILPKHKLAAAVESGTFFQTWGVDTPPEEIVGTGPFKLVSYSPGEKIVYKKNPYYWKYSGEHQLPYLSTIIGLIIPSSDIQMLKFQKGELDLIGLRGQDYGFLKKREASSDFTIYRCGPGFGSMFIVFNQGGNVDPVKKLWFRDLRFRQAAAHAIDKNAIIRNVFYGQAQPQFGPVSPAAKTFYNPDLKRYVFDLDRARQILKEASFVDTNGDGFVERPAQENVAFTIITSAENKTGMDMASLIAMDFAKIGWDVSTVGLDFNTIVSKLTYTTEWECMLISLTGGIDPHGGKNVWSPKGRLHLWDLMPSKKHNEQEWAYRERVQRWYDELYSWEKEVEDIFENGVSVLDQRKRKKMYDKWQRLASENLPLIYLVTPEVMYAVKDSVKNIIPTSYGGILHNIEEIWIDR